MRKGRNVTVRLVCAALALGLLAACSPASERAGTQEGGDSAQEPVDGGSLTVGVDEDGYTIEGDRLTLGMYPHHAQIFEQLTLLTPDYELEPMLATDWEFIEPSTWRFSLREDVTFHDGQPLDAAAVKEGLFDRYEVVDGGGPIQATADSVEIIDDYTIEFTPAEHLPIPAMVAHPNYGVAAPGSDIAESPVGTGPFQFVEYVNQDHLTVERNEDYWDEPAHLEELTFRFFPDPDARRLALEAGDIDAAFEVSRSAVEPLKDRGLTIETSDVGTYQALYVNANGEAPWDTLADRDVRRALAHAIDRGALVEHVYEGLATTDQTWVPPSVLGDHADRITGFEYDPEEAKSLLEDAGYEMGSDDFFTMDGERLSLTLVSGFPTATANRPAPSFLQEQFREVGVELEIVEVADSPAFGSRVESGEGDLFLETGNQNDGNPAFLPLFVYTGPGGYAGRSVSEPAEGYGEAVAAALESPSIDEMREDIAEALTILVDEEATVIPLAGIFRIYGMTDAVTGFDPHPSFSHQKWHTVQLQE